MTIEERLRTFGKITVPLGGSQLAEEIVLNIEKDGIVITDSFCGSYLSCAFTDSEWAFLKGEISHDEFTALRDYNSRSISDFGFGLIGTVQEQLAILREYEIL